MDAVVVGSFRKYLAASSPVRARPVSVTVFVVPAFSLLKFAEAELVSRFTSSAGSAPVSVPKSLMVAVLFPS